MEISYGGFMGILSDVSGTTRYSNGDIETKNGKELEYVLGHSLDIKWIST